MAKLEWDKPQEDRGDATPPHGDELKSERSFAGRDRYAAEDDPDAERPVMSDEVLDLGDQSDPAERQRHFERIDERAERNAQSAVRRRERTAG